MVIQIAWALPDRQQVLSLVVAPGITARAAVLQADRAGLLAELRALPAARGPDPVTAPLGVFGVVVADDHRLRPGDRVEIYRPLSMDPREARRLAAARGGTIAGPADRRQE